MKKWITEQLFKIIEGLEKIKQTPNNMYKELETMYEWEYKYNKVKQSKNIKNEKRVDKILTKIQQKLTPILNSVIDKLDDVFTEWLENHAILSPKTWARKRTEWIGDNEDFDRRSFNNVYLEYQQYIFAKDDFMEKFYEIAIEGVEDWVINDFIDGETNIAYENLEYAQEQEDEEEAKDMQKRIDELEDMNDKDKRKYLNDSFGSELGEMLGEHIFNEETFTLAYEKLVFPAWYKHWKSKGIDKTRKRVEDTHKNLNKAKKEKDLGKKIMHINIALNESHQTGSMMDYVEEQYEVNKDDLDKLSNISSSVLKNWDKEVAMMV